MIPKYIIEKAIEGGWEPRDSYERSLAWNADCVMQLIEWESIALDPTFWQSLGKALGWSGKVEMKFINAFGNTIVFKDVPRWEMHFHKFSNLILTGGDVEKFWEEILPEKKKINL